MTTLPNHPTGLRIVPRLSRRSLLLGMAAAGGAAALTTLGYRRFAEATDTTQDKVPFWGVHQAGILTPAPAAALIVAFDVTAQNKADLTQLFKILTERIEKLTQGWTPPPENPQFPPVDSGVLGMQVFPDNLTVTVAVGASLFDQRFGLASLKPQHLQAMPNYPNDQLNPEEIHGDLLLQFCSSTAETNIHALRDILKNTPAFMTPRWKIAGFLPAHTVQTSGKGTVRNLLGFKDGTANLNTNDTAKMDQLVWVTAANNEPVWATGGSYQVVRIVRNLVERWDRTPLHEQEQVRHPQRSWWLDECDRPKGGWLSLKVSVG
ncbi:MAG: Dyp-type peroxidase [Elainella sp.]